MAAGAGLSALASAGASGGIAAGIGGITSILGTVLQNRYNKRENRKNRQWADNQFRSDWIYKQNATDLAYQRDNDWQYKMSQWNKAGLNPYAMLENTFQAPVSTSGSSTPSVNPQYTDIQGGIQNAVSSVMQYKMMDADIRQKQAQTKLTEADAQGKTIDNQFKPLEKYIGIENTQAITQNTIQATDNLKSTKSLVEQSTLTEKGKTIGQNLQNSITQIESMYTEAKNRLITTGMELTNKKTAVDIQVQSKQLRVMETSIEKMKADIESAKGNQDLMKASIDKTRNEIQRENVMRQADKQATERSNVSMFSAPKFFTQQISNSWQNFRTAWKNRK
jgi:hypothetical protein